MHVSDEGSLTEVAGGYIFFWKGLPVDVRCIQGVGFAICTESPVSIDERLITLCFTLTDGNYVTVMSDYIPALMSTTASEQLYRLFHAVTGWLFSVTSVGMNHSFWAGVTGMHGPRIPTAVGFIFSIYALNFHSS